jgi:hypothetical protein
MAFRISNNKPPKKSERPTPFFLKPAFLIGPGVASIAIGVLVLGMSLYETFLSGSKIRSVSLPGFHEVTLEEPGMYAGVYQHQGQGALPVSTLMRMDVRLMSKDDYQEVPVSMNMTGQTFNRLGVQGMPVFSFVVDRAGSYALSAFSKEGSDKTPPINVMIVPQTAQNAKQTLFVGAACLVFFVGLGIFILFHTRTWSPKSPKVEIHAK